MIANQFLFLASVLFLIPLTTTEVLGDIIVNEIELEPVEGESQWLELHNPTDFSASLKNLELQIHYGDDAKVILISFLDSDTLGSGDYHVVFLEDFIQHPSNMQNITITLFDEVKILDVIEGVGDGLASDKTWQRFPDGIDSGTFKDWTFRAATEGRSNGNLGQVVAECTLDPFCWGSLDVFYHNEHHITVDDRVFLIETFYDSEKTDVDFVLEEKKIVILLDSSDFLQLGTSSSFVHVTIPDELLSGSYSVFADGKQKPFHLVSNQTNTRLIINNLTDEKLIEIVGTVVIPEFPMGSLTIVTVSIFSVLIFYRCCGSRCFLKT